MRRIRSGVQSHAQKGGESAATSKKIEAPTQKGRALRVGALRKAAPSHTIRRMANRTCNIINLYWDVLAVAAPFQRRALDVLECPELHQRTRRSPKTPRSAPKSSGRRNQDGGTAERAPDAY